MYTVNVMLDKQTTQTSNITFSSNWRARENSSIIVSC